MSEIKTLPITKQVKAKWSYFYVYDLRTVRDFFIFCALKIEMNKEELYDGILKKIPPPRPRSSWINKKGKTKQDRERTILEYEHSLRYLGLIKKRNDVFRPNLTSFKKEKRIILEENKSRSFECLNKSPELTKKEKDALLKIVLDYERARDFLRWFLDFSKFPNSLSFNIDEFRKEAKPIFILGEIEKGKKGSQILRRSIDGRIWIIPNKKPDDYTRLASYMFPNWFKELGIIDEVIVFPEFSKDKKLWHMYYPIKMKKSEFLNLNIAKILKLLFLKRKSECSIWIPYLIYVIARKYYCQVEAIKTAVRNIYKEDPAYFYLERTPLHLMKKRSKYNRSYIEVDGFFRSHLKIIKGENNG